MHIPLQWFCFCIFKKSDYLKTVQDFQEFKFNHFGHDIVILHENEIRKVAFLMISAEEPCIGALMAVRRACCCSILFLALICGKYKCWMLMRGLAEITQILK
jgi:hypothetical protein